MNAPPTSAPPPPHLPLTPGAAGERAGLLQLLDRARAASLLAPRLHGYAGNANPLGAEGRLLLTGVPLALLGLIWSSIPLFGGIVLALIAGARALGWEGPRALQLRVPCWNLLLRRPRTETRVLVAAPMDGLKPRPELRRVVFALSLLLPISCLLGVEFRLAAAAFLAVLGGLLLTLGGRGESGGPGTEARVADTMIGLAARLQTENEDRVGVVLCGNAAANGDGVLAILDWWALKPEHTRVVLVAAEGAAEGGATALRRQGYTVETVHHASVDTIEALVRRSL